MRIVFCLNGCSITPSGGYKVIFELANKLVNKGYEITIMFPSKDNLYQLPLPVDVKVLICKILTDYLHILPTWFKLDKRITIKTVKDYSERWFPSADIIVATAIETARPIYYLSKQCGKKIYFIQDYETWADTPDNLHASYALGMKNIVVSNWLKGIVDKYSVEPSVLISNSINTNVFYNKKRQRDKHSIVFHYRSSPKKGSWYAIEVVKHLQDIYSDLVVRVISNEKKHPKLPSCCYYYHSISPERVAEINNASEVFLCTSIEEGFGLPGLEAMACGCALVSTCYQGVLEYAVDGENALLSPINDVDALVINVVKLFENKKLMKDISEKATKTGCNRTLDRSVVEFEKLINSL